MLQLYVCAYIIVCIQYPVSTRPLSAYWQIGTLSCIKYLIVRLPNLFFICYPV